MAGYSVPKDSAYYYGEDGTYTVKRRAPKPPKTNLRPEYNLDAQGLPVRVNPVANTQKPTTRKFADIRGSVTPGSDEAAPDNKGEGIQMDIAERHRAGAGYPAGVQRPKDYPVQSGGGGGGTGRDTPAPGGGGGKGTQTSPSVAKPGDLNAFAELLGSKYGIQFRGGFESNNLPTKTGNAAADSGLSTTQRIVEGAKKAGSNGLNRALDGISAASRGEIAEGAQKGTSAVPDVGDQKRAVRVGRFDPRQRDGGSSGFMAADNGPIVEQGPKKGGISARSRAFLDYDGGSMMALRQAEASQGYIRQNGRNFAITGEKDGKREFTEFNDEGRKGLVKDGNAVASQEYLKNYMMPTTDAKAAENPAVEAPVQVEAQLQHTNENFGPLADSEEYGKMLDATRGMTGMGPLANGEVYGEYLDGRTPMMRDPRKK